MSTHITTTQQTLVPQGYLSPEWIYNVLMEQIDDDLTTTNIHQLEEWYKDETTQQRAARFERYAVSFQILEDTIQELAEENMLFEHEVAALMDSIAHANADKKDKAALTQIESEIDSDTND